MPLRPNVQGTPCCRINCAISSRLPGAGQPSGHRICENSSATGGLSTSTLYSHPLGCTPFTVLRFPVLRHSYNGLPSNRSPTWTISVVLRSAQGPGYLPVILTPICAPRLPFHLADPCSTGFTFRNASRLPSSSKSIAHSPPENSPSLTATFPCSSMTRYTSLLVLSIVSWVYLTIGILVPGLCGTRNSGAPSQPSISCVVIIPLHVFQTATPPR